MRSFLLLCLLAVATGCHSGATTQPCPVLDCKVSCPDGTIKDGDGCATCVCAGAPATDNGDCPAIRCSQDCGTFGFAVDPMTGCPTCNCCFPADCQPGGCPGTAANGCLGCFAC